MNLGISVWDTYIPNSIFTRRLNAYVFTCLLFQFSINFLGQHNFLCSFININIILHSICFVIVFLQSYTQFFMNLWVRCKPNFFLHPILVIPLKTKFSCKITKQLTRKFTMILTLSLYQIQGLATISLKSFIAKKKKNLQHTGKYTQHNALCSIYSWNSFLVFLLKISMTWAFWRTETISYPSVYVGLLFLPH